VSTSGRPRQETGRLKASVGTTEHQVEVGDSPRTSDAVTSAGSTASGTSSAASPTSTATALVFDRDQVDKIEDWSSQIGRLGRRSLLWIDIDGLEREEAAELVEHLGLESETERRLTSTDEQDPYLGDFGRYLHVTAFAPAHDRLEPELVRVEAMVSKQWVVTIHKGPVEALDVFTQRASGSGDVGRLDGLEFVANLLEWVLGGYFGAFAAIERELDEFDARAMGADFDTPEAGLASLVALRREIGRLRRMVVAHRPVLLALTRPELEGVSDADHSERFGNLRDQLEHAVVAARDCRDSVVLSFDVLVARTGHRTNEIMKVLTLASVLLLPGALIAGLMGMNFKMGFFEENVFFWVILAVIGFQAACTIVVARKRRWI
jgi:magnesium transporter